MPPLGLAGRLRTLAEHFQGKYRGLSSVPEASERTLSLSLHGSSSPSLSFQRLKIFSKDPELVPFPIDSATLAV